MVTTREQLRTILYDWDIDDFLDGELDPLLDSIEEAYAIERQEAIAAAVAVVVGTRESGGSVGLYQQQPWSQGDKGAQHVIHEDKPNRWDDQGTYVDWDDGHAGGYPHYCDEPNEYNQRAFRSTLES